MKHILLILLSSLCILGCAPIRPLYNIPDQPPKTRAIPMHPDVAIALGAGGAKGYAHLGVLEVLHNAGIPINLISGASAGSIVGSLYADNGSVKQAYHAMMSAKFWDLADIDRPNRMGFVSGYRLETFIFDNVDAKQFKDLKIPLLIATTDLETGKGYTIASGPIAAAVDSSAGVPGLVVPKNIYDHILIDGGVANPVPVSLLMPYQPKLIIAVDISSSLPRALPSNALDVYHRAYDIMWTELTKTSRKNADIIIHPHIASDIGTFAIKQKCLLYKIGVIAAKKSLPEILRAVKERGIKIQKPDYPVVLSNSFCQAK